MRILVVDDDWVSRHKLRYLLKPYGLTDEAESGGQAVAMVSEAIGQGNAFALITLDLQMPGLSGIETITAIRRVEAAAGSACEAAKVVVVSASRERETVVEAIGSGCDGYLAKPFSPQSLEATFSRMGIHKLD